MHRCLHIPEIIELICNEVSHNTIPTLQMIAQRATNDELGFTNHMERVMDDPDSASFFGYSIVQSRSSQLLSLAQTCRQLQQPALRNLWVSLDSIIPILSSAGKDLLEMEEDAELLKLTRPISSSDAETMKKYASYVRDFDAQDPHFSVTHEVWIALQNTFAEAPLFPNLRELSISDQIFEYASLFGTRHLTSLTIHLDAFHPSLVEFLARCPNLISLYVNIVHVRPDFEETLRVVVEALPGWPGLSRLDWFPARTEALVALSSHEKLQSIEFWDLAQDVDWELLPSLAELQTFTIHLYEDRLRENNCLRLLQSLKRYSHSLRRIVIDLRDRFSLTLTNALLSTLAANFALLTSLNISQAGPYYLLDEDVKVLTEALPLLEDVRLLSNPDHRSIRREVTIASLTFFARNCPNLSSLSIEFNGAENCIPEYPESSRPGLKLNWLGVGCSPIGHNEDAVANFIFRAFPNIQWMDWNLFLDTDLTGPWRAWSKVSKILKKKKVLN